jgi:S-DNA-T family DNA segregation ATPase FtsK/SpoIIIE
MTALDRACPHCGRVNELVDGITTTNQPKPGDVSICYGCTRIGIFTETGIRVPRPAELRQLAADPNILAAQAAAAGSLGPMAAVARSRRAARREARLLRRAAELVVVTQTGSGALLERRLHVGQEKAAQLLQGLEEKGVVGPSKGPGRVRDVLVRPDQLVPLLRDHFPVGPP